MTSNPATLTVNAATHGPNILAVFPKSGPEFTLVLIFGHHLNQVTQVDFGSQPALYLALGHHLIIAIAPPNPVGTVISR